MISKEVILYDRGLPVKARKGLFAAMSKPGTIISPMHIHKEIELIYMKEGCMQCISLDDTYTLEQGDVLFINSNAPHSTIDLWGGRCYSMVQFDFPIASDAVFRYVARLSTQNNEPFHVFPNGNPVTEQLKFYINLISEEYTERRNFWSDHVRSAIYGIVAILRRSDFFQDVPQENNSKLDKIRPAIEYIEQNYMQEVSSAKLAELLCFNESYFCRLFKQATGSTMSDYLNFFRTCKAKHLLRQGINVTEVAYQTGFSSVSYFNKVFKKYHHYSPSQHKKISIHIED